MVSASVLQDLTESHGWASAVLAPAVALIPVRGKQTDHLQTPAPPNSLKSKLEFLAVYCTAGPCSLELYHKALYKGCLVAVTFLWSLVHVCLCTQLGCSQAYFQAEGCHHYMWVCLLSQHDVVPDEGKIESVASYHLLMVWSATEG